MAVGFGHAREKDQMGEQGDRKAKNGQKSEEKVTINIICEEVTSK